MIISVGHKVYKHFRRKGYSITPNGVLVCHASPDGALAAPDWAVKASVRVVCCYPAAVIQRNPDLRYKVQGFWNTTTEAEFYKQGLKYRPSSNVDGQKHPWFTIAW